MSNTRWFDSDSPPDWKKLRSCVHCGLCLPACPTYRELKIEGDSPRGRLYLMRALHEGTLPFSEELRGHLDLCLVCRACETACPSGVPFGELMEATRAQIERREPRGGLEGRLAALAFRNILPFPARVASLAGLLRLYQKTGLQSLVRGSGVLGLFPPRLRAAEGMLPGVPPARARRTLKVTTSPPAEPRARVAFMVTCVMRPLFPDVNRATTALLAHAGAEVILIPQPGCCGALHAHAGRLDEARALARRQIENLEALGKIDFIVSNASGCGASLRDYVHWLEHDEKFAARASDFAGRVRDVTEVLDQLGLPAPVEPPGGRVAMHDPCHLAHGMKVRLAPRRLLKQAGYQVEDLENSDFCCGSAGVYNLVQPEMAEAILARKTETIRKSGAPVVAVGNPGCALQMASGARAAGLHCRMEHPLVLLARAHGLPFD